MPIEGMAKKANSRGNAYLRGMLPRRYYTVQIPLLAILVPTILCLSQEAMSQPSTLFMHVA